MTKQGAAVSSPPPLPTLVTMKRAANREQDRIDLENLRLYCPQGTKAPKESASAESATQLPAPGSLELKTMRRFETPESFRGC